MKNKRTTTMLLITFCLVLSFTDSFAKDYKNAIPFDDILKYSEILEKINNYAIPFLCDSNLYTESQGWSKKNELMLENYASYRLFKEDSTQYFSGLKEFYSSKENIVKYLLLYRNSKSTCYWIIGWFNKKYLSRSNIDFDFQIYITKRNIAAAILIINYYINSDKNSIKLFLTGKESANEIYDKLQKIIDKYYGKDIKLLREAIIKEFEVDFDYE